jgi:tRNA (uracil-5-)-methyltransferase TRM9
MRPDIAQKLLTKVKQDYASISSGFDATRQQSWGEFDFFTPYLEQGTDILDLGCGNGRLYDALKDYDISYTGVDNNVSLLEHAKNSHPKVAFLEADMLELPFPDESFDNIWSIASFHHIPSRELRLRALHEMERVLRPAGHLIITTWNLWQKKYRKHVWRALMKKLKFGPYDWNDTFIPWGSEGKTLRYYHAFRMKELRQEVEDAGFVINEAFHSRGALKVRAGKAHNSCVIAQKPV